MLSATKDQPANTEGKKKPDIVLHRFSDLLFHQPASSLVSMYLKTSLRTKWTVDNSLDDLVREVSTTCN